MLKWRTRTCTTITWPLAVVLALPSLCLVIYTYVDNSVAINFHFSLFNHVVRNASRFCLRVYTMKKEADPGFVATAHC